VERAKVKNFDILKEIVRFYGSGVVECWSRWQSRGSASLGCSPRHTFRDTDMVFRRSRRILLPQVASLTNLSGFVSDAG
jgi:hypothetical protein